MIAEPALIPVTSPNKEPTVAIDGLLLVHKPPLMVSPKEVEIPVHISDGPLMVPALEVPVTVTSFVV
jgi:hypothetical protein